MRVSWLTAPGQCEYAVESFDLNRCGFTEQTLYYGAARLNGILHRQSFEYGVLRMQYSHMPCSVLPVVGRGTPRDIESKQRRRHDLPGLSSAASVTASPDAEAALAQVHPPHTIAFHPTS
jgi:hypothetical protein